MTEHNNLDSNHSQQIKMVAVYASSCAALHPVYYDAARRMGELLAAAGKSIIYGAGGGGLMWSVVDEPEQVLEAIESSHAWDDDALQYANVTSANA